MEDNTQLNLTQAEASALDLLIAAREEDAKGILDITKKVTKTVFKATPYVTPTVKATIEIVGGGVRGSESLDPTVLQALNLINSMSVEDLKALRSKLVVR